MTIMLRNVVLASSVLVFAACGMAPAQDDATEAALSVTGGSGSGGQCPAMTNKKPTDGGKCTGRIVAGDREGADGNAGYRSRPVPESIEEICVFFTPPKCPMTQAEKNEVMKDVNNRGTRDGKLTAIMDGVFAATTSKGTICQDRAQCVLELLEEAFPGVTGEFESGYGKYPGSQGHAWAEVEFSDGERYVVDAMAYSVYEDQ